jgi:hypothetical protein
MRRTLIFGFLAALGALFGKPVLACSCVAAGPGQVYDSNSTVVLVKVVGLEKPTPAGPWTATVVVLKSWKGELRRDETVRAQTMGPGGACGFFIGVGDEILVYSDDAASLSLGLCNTVRADALRSFKLELDRLSKQGHVGQP